MIMTWQHDVIIAIRVKHLATFGQVAVLFWFMLFTYLKLIANCQGTKLGKGSVLRRGVSINISIGPMAAKLKVARSHQPIAGTLRRC